MTIEVMDDTAEMVDPAATEVINDAGTPPESEVIANEAQPVVADPAQVAPENATPAYQPNFKVSVRGEEKEVDEMFRALIKDAESEKKVKEIFEKAYGLDHVKMDRKAIQEEYKDFKGQVVPYLSEYHKFTSLRDKGNLGAALQVAGITDDQLFQYCVQKLEMEKNPHQANLYKSHTEASLREIEMETELSRYRQQDEMTKVERFQSDLDASVESMKDVAEQVDQKLGRVGAFKEEVITLGVFEHNRGNNLTVAQATEMVANKYKPFISVAPSIPSPTTPQAPAYQRPATMPNVGSSNVSPVKAFPRTVDDIRKAAREL